MSDLGHKAKLVLEAVHRHSSNPDWYSAQLACAIAHTPSIEEAITLADAMFEAEPEPPETSDEEEQSAREELGNSISKISPQKSQPASLATEDVRGVEHRGKGDPRGGQFVQHGQGGGDVSDGSKVEQFDFGDFEVDQPQAEDLVEVIGDPDQQANPVEVIDEEPGQVEVDDDHPQEPPTSPGSTYEDGVYTPEDQVLLETIIGMYPEDKREVAHNLVNTPVEAYTKLGGGANSSLLISLNNGGRGVFKDSAGEVELRPGISAGTYYRREVASSLVAHALGFGDLVPVTVPRKSGDSWGSMQDFADNSTVAAGFTPTSQDEGYFDGPEDAARAAVLDYLLGATDRHYGNWMLQGSSTAPLPETLHAEREYHSPISSPLLQDGHLVVYSDAPSEEPGDEFGSSESEFGKFELETGPSSPVVEIPPGGVDVPESEPRGQHKIVMIDNGLNFSTREDPYRGSPRNNILVNAIEKNLPMPDLSHLKDKWGQVQSIMQKSGIESEAIALTKKRFDNLVSGGAKYVSDLKNPYSHYGSGETIRDHFSNFGILNEGPVLRPIQRRFVRPMHIDDVDVTPIEEKVNKFIEKYGEDVHDEEIINVIQKHIDDWSVAPDPYAVLNKIKRRKRN